MNENVIRVSSVTSTFSFKNSKNRWFQVPIPRFCGILIPHNSFAPK
ncbi:hypothetical protein B739_2084 [Riemerella anatipestifer RA-CH-1]|uniref:Uncharacterized protein n=1 Tax=Riemerella anatipestifer RA-CH-1 TaxID=1228997 RepID=J9QU12_RIEAN|nr:hypothetical protein B739_2084 [Riemerella anatipestifer RA-CH-1]AIH01466.1 hypothetical protein M949_0295 [Riemerella anatipestifer CH3]